MIDQKTTDLHPDCARMDECHRSYHGPMPACEGVCLRAVEARARLESCDLGKRLAACPRFEWRPGMRSLEHEYHLDGRTFVAPARRWSEGEGTPHDDRAPDLRDPATRECLLELVREAWGVADLYLARIDCTPAHSFATVCWRWSMIHPAKRESVCLGLFETEAEALVAALKAAPARSGGA